MSRVHVTLPLDALQVLLLRLSTHRCLGVPLLLQAGGASTVLMSDGMTRAPLVRMESLGELGASGAV